MRYLRSDAKIDRIAVSWLHPSRVDATWLAAVADEVAVPAGPARRTDRFCYIVLDRMADARATEAAWARRAASASHTVLVIDDRHRSEAARRIPALRRAWQPDDVDVPGDSPTEAVVLELHPVDPPQRGRRHQG